MATLPTTNAASPLDAEDASYSSFTASTNNEVISVANLSMPADFATMDTLTASCRANVFNYSDDTVSFRIRIMNGSTVLAASGSAGGMITLITTAGWNGATNVDKNQTGVFNYVNTTATKAQWEGATVEIQQGYSASMANDGANIRADRVWFDGTYAAGTPSDTITGVADLAHANTKDAVVLTQVHNLAVADLGHAHTLDAANLGQVHQLAGVADLAHGNTIDAVTISVPTVITGVADLAHANTVDAVALTQTHRLTVADLAHGNTTDAAVLTQVHNLVVADLAHSSTIDAVALTQTHRLTVSDLAHSHTIDAVTLTIGGGAVSLVASDLAHASTIDAVTLSVTVNLAPVDLTHAHNLDAVTITQAHVLSVADLGNGSTIDAVTLTQVHVLSVVDLGHGHNLDVLILTATTGEPGVVVLGSLIGSVYVGTLNPGAVLGTLDDDTEIASPLTGSSYTGVLT